MRVKLEKPLDLVRHLFVWSYRNIWQSIKSIKQSNFGSSNQIESIQYMVGRIFQKLGCGFDAWTQYPARGRSRTARTWFICSIHL